MGKETRILDHNLFAYCRNSPVDSADADGKAEIAVVAGGPWAWFTGIVIGLIILAASSTSNPAPPPKPNPAAGQQNTAPPPITASIPGELGEIASGYGIGQCTDAAGAMRDYLEKLHMPFSGITITYLGGPGFMVSDITGETISTNGFHMGISYKGIVYCNVHPFGLPKKEWVDDFHGVGSKIVEEMAF